jgi:hypothetical protein
VQQSRELQATSTPSSMSPRSSSNGRYIQEQARIINNFSNSNQQGVVVVAAMRNRTVCKRGGGWRQQSRIWSYYYYIQYKVHHAWHDSNDRGTDYLFPHGWNCINLLIARRRSQRPAWELSISLLGQHLCRMYRPTRLLNFGRGCWSIVEKRVTNTGHRYR